MAVKISVLVPVYKTKEEYLRRCIESLCSQTLKEIQIILVDDGSPDDRGRICDQYAETDRRILVIHQNNKGLAAARNAAFDRAEGKYVMFIDGDDYLEENACEEAYRAAEDTKAEVVFWDIFMDYPRRCRVQKTMPQPSSVFEGRECRQLQERVLDFNGKIAQVFAKLIRRDFLVQNHIRHVEELRQGAEGIVFCLCLFEYTRSAYYLNKTLNHYVYHEGSISHSYSEENIRCIVRCFEYMEEFISRSSHPDRQRLRNLLYTRLLYVVVTTGITGYFNPDNQESFREKCRGYSDFLKIPIVKKALWEASRKKLTMQRKVVLFLAETHRFRIIAILGKLRRLQLRLR